MHTLFTHPTLSPFNRVTTPFITPCWALQTQGPIHARNELLPLTYIPRLLCLFVSSIPELSCHLSLRRVQFSEARGRELFKFSLGMFSPLELLVSPSAQQRVMRRTFPVSIYCPGSCLVLCFSSVFLGTSALLHQV